MGPTTKSSALARALKMGPSLIWKTVSSSGTIILQELSSFSDKTSGSRIQFFTLDFNPGFQDPGAEIRSKIRREPI